MSESCQEPTPVTQQREKLMRRRRFQKGSLQARKHGRNRVWVGCYWEGGGRRSKVLGCYKWAKGKPKRFVGDPPADQQRPGSGPETALHVRAVRRWRVPAVLSSQLEGIHSRDFGADCENASDFGVRETTASRDPSRPVTGFSRSDSVGSPVQRGETSAVVSECDLQTRDVGWDRTQQSGGGVEDFEGLSAGTSGALADGRGGYRLSGCFRSSRRADRTAGDFRRNAARRDPRASMESLSRRCRQRGGTRLQTRLRHAKETASRETWRCRTGRP